MLKEKPEIKGFDTLLKFHLKSQVKLKRSNPKKISVENDALALSHRADFNNEHQQRSQFFSLLHRIETNEQTTNKTQEHFVDVYVTTFALIKTARVHTAIA